MRQASKWVAGAISGCGMFLTASVSAQAKDKPAATESPAVSDNTPRRITDSSDPDYIRCRSEPIIGSLAKKRRVCMTNRAWAAHIQEGNKRAKQFVSDMQGGMRTDVP